MTPQNHPQAVDLLAAEYVLGTLRGPARRRFEAWRAGTPLVQERCRFWEDHLLRLASSLRPMTPPPHVWQGVSARLNLSQGEPRRSSPARVWAIAASVLLVASLAALLYWRSIEPGPLTAVATISSPEGTSLWEVDIYRASGRMIVHATRPPARAADRDFELWALPAGKAPVSLGVLPVAGTVRRALTAAQQQALANAPQVAVTVEALGGSPTGQPTSTPIYVVPVRVTG